MGNLGAVKKGREPVRASHHHGRRSSCPRGSRGAWRTCGSLASILYQLVGGLRSNMGCTSSKSIQELPHEGEVRAGSVTGPAREPRARRHRDRRRGASTTSGQQWANRDPSRPAGWRLHLMRYAGAHCRRAYARGRIARRSANTLLLLEHEPVVTFGKGRATRRNDAATARGDRAQRRRSTQNWPRRRRHLPTGQRRANRGVPYLQPALTGSTCAATCATCTCKR